MEAMLPHASACSFEIPTNQAFTLAPSPLSVGLPIFFSLWSASLIPKNFLKLTYLVFNSSNHLMVSNMPFFIPVTKDCATRLASAHVARNSSIPYCLAKLKFFLDNFPSIKSTRIPIISTSLVKPLLIKSRIPKKLVRQAKYKAPITTNKGNILNIVAIALLATAMKPILIADNNLVVPTADIIKAEYAEDNFRNNPYNTIPPPTTVSIVPKADTNFIIPPTN